MKGGSFIFDGVPSEDIKTIIQARPLIEAPLRKTTQRAIYGVDGTVPFDEGAYDNTNMSLVMLIDGNNVISDRQKFYDLVDSRGVYKDFIPYFDPTKIYRVMLSEKISFENTYIYGEKQALSVKFTVRPYKYLVVNPTTTINGKTGTMNNPTNYVSQPLITLYGSGTATLKVNGIDFNIKNIVEDITLDSERYSAYREDDNGVLTPMNYQVATREYPIFNPGVNTIAVTGNVTKIVIKPRWRSLV